MAFLLPQVKCMVSHCSMVVYQSGSWSNMQLRTSNKGLHGQRRIVVIKEETLVPQCLRQLDGLEDGNNAQAR